MEKVLFRFSVGCVSIRLIQENIQGAKQSYIIMICGECLARFFSEKEAKKVYDSHVKMWEKFK